MANQELEEYLKILRMQNESDESAKAKLLALNIWPPEEVEKAFVHETPVVDSQPTTPVTTPSPDLAPVKKSLISKILFASFCLFSLAYIASFTYDMYQLMTFHAQIKSVLYLIKFPWVAFLPFALSVSLLLLVLTSLKIRNLTKKTWALAMFTVNIYPFLYSAIAGLIVFAMYAGSNDLLSQLIKKISSPVNFAALPVLIILILSFRKATETPKKLVLPEKLILVVSFLLLVVPSLTISGYQLASLNSIPNRTQILAQEQEKIKLQSQPAPVVAVGGTEVTPEPTPSLSFKLYSLFAVPAGLQYSSQPDYNGKLSDITGAVVMSLTGQDGKTVLITQVGAPVDFNLANFLTQNYKIQPTKVESKISQDGFAYVIENPSLQAGSPVALFLVTKDNVLIRVHSASIPKDTILKVANSLK